MCSQECLGYLNTYTNILAFCLFMNVSCTVCLVYVRNEIITVNVLDIQKGFFYSSSAYFFSPFSLSLFVIVSIFFVSTYRMGRREMRNQDEGNIFIFIEVNYNKQKWEPFLALFHLHFIHSQTPKASFLYCTYNIKCATFISHYYTIVLYALQHALLFFFQ